MPIEVPMIRNHRRPCTSFSAISIITQAERFTPMNNTKTTQPSIPNYETATGEIRFNLTCQKGRFFLTYNTRRKIGPTPCYHWGWTVSLQDLKCILLTNRNSHSLRNIIPFEVTPVHNLREAEYPDILRDTPSELLPELFHRQTQSPLFFPHQATWQMAS